jgi:homogentisate 1,2-dioxygenase
VNGPARGYVCENYGAKFTLPDRGPIGANCLANPRDFKTPVGGLRGQGEPCTLTVKWGGKFYRCDLGHSPLDVVAWHGNYAPYKYDLRTFSPVGALLFDHPDPSIFTVLTSPSGEEGTANIDFLIFPERWSVAEHTFRPPWYHMNVMSEFMGLVYGVYDAKPEGFVPGGMSLHNTMLPHGPDSDAFNQASTVELKPVRLPTRSPSCSRPAIPSMSPPTPPDWRRSSRLCRLLGRARQALHRQAVMEQTCGNSRSLP